MSENVTDAQVETALTTWFKGEISWDKGMAPWSADQFRSEMRATLEAALAAAPAPPPSSHVEGVKLSAETVIAIRDALIADDVMEAYHQLYQAVDPQFCRYEPWADTEAQLRRSPSETPTPPGNQIRTAECDGKDAVPVNGQLPVGTASPQLHAPPLTWLIAKRGGLEAVTEYVTYRAASLANDYAILEIDGKRVLQDFTSVEAACRAAFADHTLRFARAALATTEGSDNG